MLSQPPLGAVRPSAIMRKGALPFFLVVIYLKGEKHYGKQRDPGCCREGCGCYC